MAKVEIHGARDWILSFVFSLQMVLVSGQQYKPTTSLVIPTHAYKAHGTTILTYVSAQLTWNDASQVCRSLYASGAGTLVRIDTYLAQKFVQDTASLPAPWIGLHWHSQNANKQNLVWDDPHCSSFDEQGFSQFRSGNADFNTKEQCYFLEPENGVWQRSSCNAQRPFVCEHQDVTQAMNCPTDTKNGFLASNARIVSVSRNGANHNTCTRDCGDEVGCFMVYPGSSECVMGMVGEDTGDVLFIKDVCYHGQQHTGNVDGHYTHNDEMVPRDCAEVDTNFLTGGEPAAPDTGSAPSSSTPSASDCDTSTVTVTDTVTESSPCVTYSTIELTIQSTSTCVIAPTATITDRLTTTVTSETVVRVTESLSCSADQSPAATVTETTTVMETETVTSVTTEVVTSTVALDETIVSTVFVSTPPITVTETLTATVTSTDIQVSGLCNTSSSGIIDDSVGIDTEPHTISDFINASISVSPIDIESITASIVSELKLPSTSLSQYRRKKESAPDSRTSSKVSGAVAIAVVTLIFGSVVAMDANGLFIEIVTLKNKMAAA